MGESFKTIIEKFSNLSKNKQFILGVLILLIILLIISGDIGSNNKLKNINYGIQGNGNNQNSKNKYENKIDNSTHTITDNSTHTTVVESNKVKNTAYKNTFIAKEGGNFVVTDEWKNDWEPYLNVYINFVTLPTEKGYLLLNSPNQIDKYDFSTEKYIKKIVGFIKTKNGIFYMTKYSYDNRNKDGFPKFIYPIE